MTDNPSTFQTVPKIMFGWGAVQHLGEAAKALKATRVAVVTDAGVVQAGVHGTGDWHAGGSGPGFPRFLTVWSRIPGSTSSMTAAISSSPTGPTWWWALAAAVVWISPKPPPS